MKKSRYSESQIVGILNEADTGVKVQDIWRKNNISSATYYKWKSRYGGMEVSDVKRLKESLRGRTVD
jgi:putative transposase